MFHSPYCFLSKKLFRTSFAKKFPYVSLSLLFSFKKTIQNLICKKVPICFTLLVVFFQKTIQNLIRQIASTKLPFRCNICQIFMQISIVLPHINKTGVGNSSVHPNLLPPHRFFTYFQFSNFFKFLTYLFRTLTRSDGHIGHLLTVQVTAGLQSRPDHGIPFFC